MKKKLLSIFLLISSYAFSQSNITFGVKAGINLSSLNGDYPDTSSDVSDSKSKIGFHLGGFAEYEINDKFSLQPELLISTQGGKFEIRDNYNNSTYGDYYESFTQTTKLTYLNLPIMLKYEIIENLKIEFGPQIGYTLSAKSKWEYVDSTDSSENEDVTVDLLNGGTYEYLGSTIIIKPRINKIDFSLNLGASYDLNDEISIQGRYNLGLSVVDKNSTNGSNTDSWNLKNSVFQISVGYKLN